MTEDLVVLVDSKDRELGTAPKLEAHRSGQLHRAVSVFVSNPTGDVLLQRRAPGKYHSPGLWSNACCTHPRPGESTLTAARRRLREEMGLDCALTPAFTFVYRADVGAGLQEHELDHVFIGLTPQDPVADPVEVAEWRWIRPDELTQKLRNDPRDYTAWLPLAWARLRDVKDRQAGKASSP